MINTLLEYLIYFKTTTVILIILGFIMCFYAYNSNFKTQSNTWNFLFIILILLMIWRIGSQPIGFDTGGDRSNYANNFLQIKDNEKLPIQQGDNDQLFTYIAYFFPSNDAELYFLFLGILYVGLYTLSCYKLENKSALWLFLTIILSFGFVSYGINTMRAGLAFAFVMLGIANKKLFWTLVSFFCAVNIHFSTVIPIIMILLSRYVKFQKFFIFIWIVCVLLSLIVGDYFNTLFASMFEGEEDRASYLMGTGEKYEVGFRIDFIIYSLIPLLVGWYYIYKKGFNSTIYKMIYNAYLLTNSFWLLVIRADFSDRFAYLSWFMIPLVLAYPLLKNPNLVAHPNKWMGTILLGETAFLLSSSRILG